MKYLRVYRNFLLESSEFTDVELEIMVNDSTHELKDLGFAMRFEKTSRKYNWDSGEFFLDRIDINLNKRFPINEHEPLGLGINCKFDKSGITSKTILPSIDLPENASTYLDICDDISYRLINVLDYSSGEFSISFKKGDHSFFADINHFYVTIYITIFSRYRDFKNF